jgi:basic membrane protein A
VGSCLERNPDAVLAQGTISRSAIEAARTHRDMDFVVLGGPRTRLANVVTVRFADAQPAFLAGYLAAARSFSHRIGAFASDLTTAGPLLNGFAAGAAAYARDEDQPTRVLGWNPDTGRGMRARTPDQARTAAKQLISNGADVILADAGRSGVAAARVALAVGHVTLVWTGQDGCDQFPRYCVVFLTSVEDRLGAALRTLLQRETEGKFSGGTYEATLANGGVALGPFHMHDTEVPVELKSRLMELAGGITEGSVSLAPSDYLRP